MRREKNILPRIAQRMLLRFLRSDLAEEVLGDLMCMFNHKGTKTQYSVRCLDALRQCDYALSWDPIDGVLKWQTDSD